MQAAGTIQRDAGGIAQAFRVDRRQAAAVVVVAGPIREAAKLADDLIGRRIGAGVGVDQDPVIIAVGDDKREPAALTATPKGWSSPLRVTDPS